MARGTRRPHARRPRSVPRRPGSVGGGDSIGPGSGCLPVVVLLAGMALLGTAAGVFLALKGA